MVTSNGIRVTGNGNNQTSLSRSSLLITRYSLLVAFTACLLAGCSGQVGHLPSEDEILGEWRTVSGPEQLDYYFSAGSGGSYYFNTSQDGRPYQSGTYLIDQNKLVLYVDQNTTSESPSLLLRGNELSFYQDGIKVLLRGSERSRRCNPLFRFLRKRSGLEFTGPVTLDFSWRLPGGDQAEIKGFELTASATAEIDPAAGLLALGFKRDEDNCTEAMESYRQDRLVCQIFRLETEGALPLIIVRCGLLVP
ncbi:MAG: lipocalin family protein [Candidatus Margulisbacteria bacterium]|jgi:hypothetical protein|nr:lipocalin family protein [Candidatus Margulisiibacteriota bacterium]